jgi:hypothetical protein
MSSEFDVRLSYPYMVGVYAAINAIPDAILAVDGRSCSVPKAQQIYGNHDWRSTLLSCDGQHRILHTNIERREVWRDRREEIRQLVSDGLARAGARVVFIGAQRMASIGEPPYAEIADELQPPDGASLVLLPTRADGDWLAGYADALAGLARRLPLERSPAGARRGVALCGYLMDRNEDDHRGNLRELERLLAALGAEIVSVWLDGRPTTSLAAAGRAELIVSLPYGREAARVLSERTGAPLLETELPMGLDGTTRWLRQVGEALGAGAAVQALVDRELDVAAPRLEWVVPAIFLNRALGFMGDPHLCRAFVGMVHELGARVPVRAIWAADGPELDDLRADALDDPVVIVDPRQGEPAARLAPVLAERGVELVVGSCRALADVPPEVAVVELGFPSFDAHALWDRPFLGYRGCLCLAERMVEQRRLHDLLRARRRRYGEPLGGP